MQPMCSSIYDVHSCDRVSNFCSVLYKWPKHLEDQSCIIFLQLASVCNIASCMRARKIEGDAHMGLAIARVSN